MNGHGINMVGEGAASRQRLLLVWGDLSRLTVGNGHVSRCPVHGPQVVRRGATAWNMIATLIHSQSPADTESASRVSPEVNGIRRNRNTQETSGNAGETLSPLSVSPGLWSAADFKKGLTRRRGDAEMKEAGIGFGLNFGASLMKDGRVCSMAAQTRTFASWRLRVRLKLQTTGNHAKTLRRKDTKKMNQNFISAQFWGQPDEGRNGVLNSCPDQHLCVFASWREVKTSDSGNHAKTLRR